mmetsp:Transcript_78669/g.227385  ORF Transcript_78669/g.227385 Transcript_78669/m.227385 type:complete len:263 (-) Transcript_78669:691-1479(-)
MEGLPELFNLDLGDLQALGHVALLLPLRPLQHLDHSLDQRGHAVDVVAALAVIVVEVQEGGDVPLLAPRRRVQPELPKQPAAALLRHIACALRVDLHEGLPDHVATVALAQVAHVLQHPQELREAKLAAGFTGEPPCHVVDQAEMRGPPCLHAEVREEDSGLLRGDPAAALGVHVVEHVLQLAELVAQRLHLAPVELVVAGDAVHPLAPVAVQALARLHGEAFDLVVIECSLPLRPALADEALLDGVARPKRELLQHAERPA